MIASLIGTITIMRRLGMPAATTTAESKVNICPTRVSSISVIGRFAIMQDGMRWFKTGEGDGRVELDPVAVEKWFSQNCKVASTPEGANEAPTPLLTFAYVSGLPSTLMVNEAGVFTLGQEHFRSLELSQAITQLENLPIAIKPGQNTK